MEEPNFYFRRDKWTTFQKWNLIYKCFAHWSTLGIFEKIFAKLNVKSDFATFSMETQSKILSKLALRSVAFSQNDREFSPKSSILNPKATASNFRVS